MRDCDYYRPTTLAEALEIKAARGEEALFVAGGTDVQVLRHQGRLDPAALISLRRLEELKGISAQGGTIFIGAGVTISELRQSELVADRLPILLDAARVMGSTQMRNVATIGGNLMSAASSGDTLPPLLALGALCHLAGPEGARVVAMDDFLTGPRQSAARPGELLTHLTVEVDRADQAGAFYKLTRRAAMDLAIMNLAVQLTLSPDRGLILGARVAAGVLAPTVVRLPQAEAALTGQPPELAVLLAAADCASGECTPRDSLRGTQWYRREMVCVLLPRVAARALGRLGVDLPDEPKGS